METKKMDFEKIASTLTNEEIDTVIGIFYEEQQRRKRARHQKLIDNFHNAFSELRKAGILPKYYEEYNEGCSAVYIEDWEGFEFV